MMHLGYKQLDIIVTSAIGRLFDKHYHKLISVARKRNFIALCQDYARRDDERKSLWDILRCHHMQILHLNDKTGDDADLILSSKKHDYGACEVMTNDPGLGVLHTHLSVFPPRVPGTPYKFVKRPNSELI